MLTYFRWFIKTVVCPTDLSHVVSNLQSQSAGDRDFAVRQLNIWLYLKSPNIQNFVSRGIIFLSPDMVTLFCTVVNCFAAYFNFDAELGGHTTCSGYCFITSARLVMGVAESCTMTC